MVRNRIWAITLSFLLLAAISADGWAAPDQATGTRPAGVSQPPKTDDSKTPSGGEGGNEKAPPSADSDQRPQTPAVNPHTDAQKSPPGPPQTDTQAAPATDTQRRDPAPSTAPATESLNKSAPAGGSRSRWIDLIMPTISAGMILLAGCGFGALAYHFYAARGLRACKNDIADALMIESISLSDVGTEIRRLNGDFNDKVKEIYADHEKNTADLKARLAAFETGARQHQTPTPDQLRTKAVVACIDDALQAFAAGGSNSDVKLLDETIGMQTALQATKSFLEKLPASNEFSEQLLAGLDHGQLDHALTTAGLLDTYFADRPAFRHARVAYRSLEALLISLLHGHGVHILQPPLLSIISTADVPNMQADDRRSIRNIPLIRQTAARVARGLEPNEVLIVDCPAPGWSSSKPIGRRQPQIAIFESSSWT